MGPLQDIPHVEILHPVTRTSRTVRVPEQAARELDEAVARAMGDAGEPGPVYLEFPTDVLRTTVPPQLVLDEWMRVQSPRRLPPDPDKVAQAVDVFWSAKRPLVITGRGAASGRPRARTSSRRNRRSLLGHTGKPRARTIGSSFRRRRGTSGCHE